MSWKNPLRILLPDGHHIIRTSALAAQCLLVSWPEHALGAEYRVALRACLDDMEHKPNAARELFVAAAQAARVPILPFRRR